MNNPPNVLQMDIRLSMVQQKSGWGRRTLDMVFDGCAAIAALCVVAICLLMIVQSLSREFAIAVRGIDDIVGWLCAAGGSLMLAHAFQRGGIVRFELLLDKLSSRGRRGVELISLSITSLFGFYASYAVGSFVYQSWEIGDLSQGQIVVPLWIPQFFTLVGCAVFSLALADELLRVIRRGKPRYQLAQEDKVARGDFEEGI